MKKRLIELDILRGLSILGMILVITPGNWSHRFAWTNHADWRGYPLSDMIFPSFLFCVGMSMAISFNKNEFAKNDYSRLFKKVFKRSILLILIGLLVNGFPFYDLQNLRIPGILQRIALCYFMAASLWLFLKKKQVKSPVVWLSVISFLIVIMYHILLFYIPVPGIGVAGDNSFNSWPTFLDQKVFGVNHLWKYGLTDGKVTYDSEGILATFPACINVILGLIIGVFYTKKDKLFNTLFLFGLGLCLVLIGFFLDYLNIMPVIKKIWTGSFAILSGGFSLLVLVLIRLLRTYIPLSTKLFYPVIVYGANAILAFVISNALIPVFDMPIHGKSIRNLGFDFFNSFIESKVWSSFSFTLVFLFLLFLLLHVLYKKNIYLKV